MNPIHPGISCRLVMVTRTVILLVLLVGGLFLLPWVCSAENFDEKISSDIGSASRFHGSSTRTGSIPGPDAGVFSDQDITGNQKDSEVLRPVDVTVHCIDVGQGDCILVQSGGKNMMIDSGPSSAGPKVISYLRKTGVASIDILIATHPHEDHIGGMAGILSTFPVSRFIDSGVVCSTQTYLELVEKLEHGQTPCTEVRKGDIIPFAPGITVKVLGPDTLTGDLNEDSIVLEVTDGASRFLLTGDSTTWSEPATVLKVPHHGSLRASTFIREVNPRVAVISAGAGNSYGHPAQETLNALRRSGATTYRTDRDGTIVVSTNGKTWSVQKTGNGQAGIQTVTTPVSTVRPTIRPFSAISSRPVSGRVPCNCLGPDLDCDDFQPGQGQKCYEYCWSRGYQDIFRLDGNNDGQACEDDKSGHRQG